MVFSELCWITRTQSTLQPPLKRASQKTAVFSFRRVTLPPIQLTHLSLLFAAFEGIEEMKSLAVDDEPITVSRILHIDDDPVFLELVKGIFADERSITVVSCVNALDALATVESLQPALIISDISMPNMGGLELVHNLRQNASTSNTPIILVSAHTRALDEYEDFTKLSVVALQKPVDLSYLRQQVKALLDEAARRRD